MASTPRSIDAGVTLGEIFVDKYRVDAILGHGGMGVVALCTHLALNEQVAIKMLRRDVLDDADAVERFMREAQAAVKLKSEYVARVTDVGRSRSNVPYMVMEYLEGHDLGELLDERGNLGQPWAVELTLQACEALAEAHSIGIVHRDVKPTNLFVTWRPDGSALLKVLDFGISKALTGNAMQLTQTQSLLGTPAYMSPEQMRSARMVDARTDIWSLGTVLYEMLEGRRPFEAESFSEMCVKVAVDPPGAMTNTPLALQQVVLRCLEKTPEQRYPSMADLARDLVPFSQDPHQAQVLVERMSRMLRRSQVFEWNPSPGEVSGPVRAARSAERPAEPAPADAPAQGVPSPQGDSPQGGPSPHGDPDPRLAADRSRSIRVGSDPRSAADPDRASRLGSGEELPAPGPSRRTGTRRSVSETMAVARPRRRGAIVIAAAAAAVAAALGAAISLARAPDPDHPDPRVNVPPASATPAPAVTGSAAPPGTATEAPAPAEHERAAARADQAASDPVAPESSAPSPPASGEVKSTRPGGQSDHHVAPLRRSEPPRHTPPPAISDDCYEVEPLTSSHGRACRNSGVTHHNRRKP